MTACCGTEACACRRQNGNHSGSRRRLAVSTNAAPPLAPSSDGANECCRRMPRTGLLPVAARVDPSRRYDRAQNRGHADAAVLFEAPEAFQTGLVLGRLAPLSSRRTSRPALLALRQSGNRHDNEEGLPVPGAGALLRGIGTLGAKKRRLGIRTKRLHAPTAPSRLAEPIGGRPRNDRPPIVCPDQRLLRSNPRSASDSGVCGSALR